MRIFIAVLILIFSLQSLSKADDVSDFEIEGMSIGESALNYFDEEILIKNKQYYTNSKSTTFFLTNVYSNNFKKFDNIMFHFKDNDSEYTIHSISGAVFFTENAEFKNNDECMRERNKLDKEFIKIFENSTRTVNDDEPHVGDPTGKSYERAIYYWLNDGSLASTSCNVYSKTFGGNDHFKVAVFSKEFADWLTNVAYE